jgi:hypothetical protein
LFCFFALFYFHRNDVFCILCFFGHFGGVVFESKREYVFAQLRWRTLKRDVTRIEGERTLKCVRLLFLKGGEIWQWLCLPLGPCCHNTMNSLPASDVDLDVDVLDGKLVKRLTFGCKYILTQLPSFLTIR